MKEEGFKPIVKPSNVNPSNETNKKIELPAIKVEQQTSQSNLGIVKDLPDWNIEPPLEIKRGNL